MRIILIAMAMVGLTVAYGCRNRATVQTEEKSLTLIAPDDVKIARGGTAQITIRLDRKNFTDPVKLKFENLPSGIKVAEAGGVDLKAGPVHVDLGHEPPAINGDEAIYTLTADADAVLVKNSSVTLSTNGPDGKALSVSFKVTVKEKP